jgi:hypothetical protein
VLIPNYFSLADQIDHGLYFPSLYDPVVFGCLIGMIYPLIFHAVRFRTYVSNTGRVLDP